MAKNLTLKCRIQLQTMLENGHKQIEIANYIGCARTTIYRELKRFPSSHGSYNARLAHKTASNNMIRQVIKGPSDETIALIESKILIQWSPEQISNWLKKHDYETASHCWIYGYIKRDKDQGGELSEHMRRGPYSKKPREYRGNIVDRVSIEKRPSIVDERSRIGDYEIDLIVGPKNRGAILSIIERTSRHCILEKLTGKSAKEVSEAVIRALLPYKMSAYTITSDNGTEFSNHKDISTKLKSKYYFAHPYASYERGSIENLNGLVRQYIPKGTDFDEFDQDIVKQIEDRLNNRPRKILDYWAPNEYLSLREAAA